MSDAEIDSYTHTENKCLVWFVYTFMWWRKKMFFIIKTQCLLYSGSTTTTKKKLTKTVTMFFFKLKNIIEWNIKQTKLCIFFLLLLFPIENIEIIREKIAALKWMQDYLYKMILRILSKRISKYINKSIFFSCLTWYWFLLFCLFVTTIRKMNSFFVIIIRLLFFFVKCWQKENDKQKLNWLFTKDLSLFFQP